jgi:hypothetical protein
VSVITAAAVITHRRRKPSFSAVAARSASGVIGSLLETRVAHHQLRDHLKQAALGKLSDLGSFAQYADDAAT